jgi:dienelactone hydrolase
MAKRFALALVLLVVGCGGGGDEKEATPSGPFAYDREAALNFQDAGRVNRNYPIEIRQVSFAGPGGRVTGLLARPPGEGPFPGVVLMHGAEGDSSQIVLPATWLAGRGAVTLAIDSPFARAPRDLGRGIEALRAEFDLIAQNVVELRRALDVLQDQSAVDDDKLGFVGFSAGARTGAILAGNEDRIDAYAFLSAGSPPVSQFLESVPSESRTEVGEILNVVDPLRHIRNAAPAKLLFQNGRRDQVVPRAALLGLYRAASKPKEIRWYPSGHEPTPRVHREMLAWLTAELGLSPRPVVAGARVGP